MKKTKLAWLHPHFNNWMGGHEYIYQVAKILRKNYDLKIITSTASPYAIKKFKDIGIKLETLNTTSTYNPLYWFFLPYFLQKEINILKEKLENYDAVISSYFPSGIWAQSLNIKHLQICYEPLAFFYDKEFLKGFTTALRLAFKILKIFYKNLDKQAILSCDKLFTLSEFNKNWIKKVYGRNDTIITYEGVDFNFFKPINVQKQNIILHSTDFTKIKGTEFIIDALPIITRKIPNIKLLITHTLENQKEKIRLTNIAKSLGVYKNIKFLGRVKYKLLPQLYSKAKVVIQPSIGQSMSLSVKEAMSCKTPIITCLEGWEQTKNNQAGFLVNSKNPEEIANAAIKILTNKNLERRMGQKGREIILEKFTWDKVTQTISKFL